MLLKTKITNSQAFLVRIVNQCYYINNQTMVLINSGGHRSC